MARIPGVPTLDPVNQPMMSPAEAGKPGQAIAELGQVSNDVVETGLALDLYIKKAQEHVDSLAAQNDLAKVYADTQDQLSKTQNSRDVAAIVEQSNKNLNSVAADWSKSPASVSIQMSADALRPDLTRIGTVRQVDLMGKELKITLNQQAEVLSQNYAADRASGGSGDMALGAFATAVHGGVTTGLLGDAEAGEYVRQFRQKGQELQLKNGITNANPEVNQKTYDDIEQHRDQFPDVTQEQLDVMKGQALAAFEAHTKHQEWAEGQMAQNTMLRPLIQLHTNPATQQFDMDGATADIAKQFEDGKISVTQEKVLTEGIKGYQADLNGSLDKQAGKIQDDIIKMFHDHKYQEAFAEVEKQRPWLEQNGMSDLYKGLMNYGDTQRREERTEARQDYALERQFQAEQSSDTLGGILVAMAQGHTFTDAQIYGLAGQGRGKLKSADAMEAIRASKAYEADPNTQAAVKLMTDSFPITKLPSTATVDEVAAAATPNAKQNKRIALTYQQWQKRVNENPKEDKVKAMQDVLQPAIQDHIADQINQLFGTPAAPKDSGSWLTRAPGESWTDWWAHRTGGAKDTPSPASIGSNIITQSFQGREVPGLIEPGNLDITQRPNIDNHDGTHSSTFSMSFGTDKGEVLVPGVGDGSTYPARKLTTKEALDQYNKTGNNFGTFKTVKAADAYAQKLHEDQAKYGNNGKAAPKDGDTKKNSSGDTVVYHDGRWGPA